MKKCLFFLLCTLPGALMAQQALNNAVIKAKMEVTTDNGNNGDGGGGGMVIQMAGNETEIVAYLKDSLRKVVTKSNSANNITLYDGKTGVSTMLTETMGEKTGFTQNEAQRLDQRRRIDSITKAREGEENSGGQVRVMRFGGGGGDKTVNIAYTDEAKTVNNIKCKKVVVTTENKEGVQKKTDVWYTPDFTMPTGVSLVRSTLNLSGLKGMPVLYEQTNEMNIGGNAITMIMHYEVKSIETAKTIEDKEFEIPKGYKIKTWDEFLKDNPDGMPPRRTIRIGG